MTLAGMASLGLRKAPASVSWLTLRSNTPLRNMKRKPRPSLPRLFDKPKYRQRNIIERMFG